MGMNRSHDHDFAYDLPYPYKDSLQQLKHGEAADILQDQAEDWDDENRLYEHE